MADEKNNTPATPAPPAKTALDELSRLGMQDAAPDSTKPAQPAAAGNELDKLAQLGSEGTPAASPLKREGTLAAMNHFDDVDSAAARKSTKAKPDALSIPESVKGTAAAEQLAKYQKLAAEIQQAREALDAKRSWTEKGADKTAKVEKLKAEMAKKQAEMKQVRDEFATQNKGNVDHINGLRASRRLDGLSMIQGSLVLADTLVNGDPNAPGRNTQIALGTAQLTQSTVGAGLNTAALWKPESEALKRAASGFGTAGNGFGAALNSYNLVQQWNSGTIDSAFSGDNSKIKTWDSRAQVGSSTAMLVGDLASIGSRGAAWYTGTATVGTASTLGNVAYGANVVGLILLDAKLIYDDVVKWNEFQEGTREIAAHFEADAIAQAGKAGISRSYVDIPGAPPSMTDYSKLYTSLRWLQGRNNYDITYLDRKAQTDKDPIKMVRWYKSLIQDTIDRTPTEEDMKRRAEAVGWVNDSLMGHILSSKRDQEMVVQNLETGAQWVYEGKAAKVALEEFDGSMPTGTRNYIARFDDYMKILKPLEKDSDYQVKQFIRIPGIMRATNPDNRYMGLTQLGISSESAQGKAFLETVMRGEALDNAKLAGPIGAAIQKKDAESIRKALDIDEASWNYRYGTNKSMKENVEEMVKANNLGGLSTFAYQHVKHNGEARIAATGWLAKDNFKEEMKIVEALIAEDVKNKAPQGKGKADEYFRKNAAFRKAGGDRWKGVNFALVGLSSSFEEYTAKKMEFAPLTLVEDIKKTTEKLNADLAKAMNDNKKLTADLTEVTAQAKELGSELEEMELRRDGELMMRSDGKGGEVPMTITDRINIYDESVRREEEIIKMLTQRIEEKQFTFETKEEMDAKVAFHNQAVAQLKTEREVMIQTGSLFKLNQLDQIKKEYTAETNKIFEEVKATDPKVLEKASADDKKLIDAATKDLTEKVKSLQAIKTKPDVSVAEALKTETAMLKARRQLATLLRDTAKKTKDLKVEDKLGMSAPGGGTSLAKLSTDEPATPDLANFLAFAQGDSAPQGGESELGGLARPQMPAGANRPQDKGRVT